MDKALPAVYAATDRALGRVFEAADPDEVVLFSLHGMGSNTSRVEILDEMLQRILSDGGSADQPLKRLQQLRRATPPALKHLVKESLPTPLQDRLTGYWRTGGRDWEKTRALTQTADLTGYVRLNKTDREAAGILSCEQASELCDQIAEGLGSFVDADTGEPVVQRTARIEEVVPDGPHRGLLPDLMVDWSMTPAARHRAVVSDRFGRIDWPTPGRHPSGRSGNHRAEGFYLACGPGVAHGEGRSGNIIDLAPTVLSRLGADAAGHLQGRPLWGGSDDNPDAK